MYGILCKRLLNIGMLKTEQTHHFAIMLSTISRRRWVLSVLMTMYRPSSRFGVLLVFRIGLPLKASVYSRVWDRSCAAVRQSLVSPNG